MTTNTDIDAGEHPPQGEDGAEQKKVKPFARKGVRIGVAAAATVALVASGVTAWAVHDHRARVADAHETYEAEIAEAEDRGAQSRTDVGVAYVQARDALDDLVQQGRQVLQDSEDRVEDDQVRTDLATALEVAETFTENSFTVQFEDLVVSPDDLIVGEVEERTYRIAVATDPSIDEVDAAHQELEEAIQAVLDAQMAWAIDDLESVIEAGQDTLESTKDEVADEDLRDDLAAAIEAGEAALADTGAEVQDLTDAAKAIRDARSDVRDSHQEWKDEQEAQRQAEAERQQRGATTPTGNTGGSSGSTGSSGNWGGTSGSTGGSSSGGSSGSTGGGSSSGGSSSGGGGGSNSGGGTGGGGNTGGGGGNSGGGSTPPPSGPSFGPSHVQGIVNQYANATSNQCSPAGQFAGDSGANWAAYAANAQAQFGYVKFQASGNSSWVTVTVLSCLAN